MSPQHFWLVKRMYNVLDMLWCAMSPLINFPLLCQSVGVWDKNSYTSNWANRWTVRVGGNGLPNIASKVRISQPWSSVNAFASAAFLAVVLCSYSPIDRKTDSQSVSQPEIQSVQFCFSTKFLSVRVWCNSKVKFYLEMSASPSGRMLAVIVLSISNVPSRLLPLPPVKSCEKRWGRVRDKERIPMLLHVSLLAHLWLSVHGYLLKSYLLPICPCVFYFLHFFYLFL